jgi:aryl-alcohol dehydrogenase-like predicted oxidoreductase
MKIGIGTVQFGLNYGISNASGQTSEEDVGGILEIATLNGIRIVDTAAHYGTSEEVLGSGLPENHQFRIITKTQRFSKAFITPSDAHQLEETFMRSLKNLRSLSVAGLMIHHADDLLAENGELLWHKMVELKQKGLVGKIGVSVYTANQIDGLLQRFPLELIQLPINVLDQRLIQTGHLKKIKERGIEIHARSVFLQGLLVMDPDRLSPYFNSVKQHLKRYFADLKLFKITPVQAALGLVSGLGEIDAVICGVNNPGQLEELCSAVKSSPTIDFSLYAINDEKILNPSLWRPAA